jgi:hypothetical protein
MRAQSATADAPCVGAVNEQRSLFSRAQIEQEWLRNEGRSEDAPVQMGTKPPHSMLARPRR